MMGPTHYQFGFLAGVTYGTLAGQDLGMTFASGVIATATAHGKGSPDMDQSPLWVKVRQALPDSCDQVMNHRELTHWWGLPVLAAALIPTLAPSTQWPMWALLVGWVSHLLGDLLFGELPVWPGGKQHVGLGLDTGGFLETGTVKVGGRQRTVIPFGPVRVLIGVGIVAVLVGLPIPDIANRPPPAHEGASGGQVAPR